MRVTLVLVGLLAAFAAVGAVAYAMTLAGEQVVPEDQSIDLPELVNTGPQPKITNDMNFVYNFGEMALGEEQSYTFTLKNEGEGPLELEGAGSTCKCTMSDLETKVLQPGETLDVTLTWEPKAPAEEFRQQARIATNQADRQLVLLEVKGSVLREVFVDPGGVWQVGPIEERTSEDEPLPEVGGYVVSGINGDFEVAEVLEKPDWAEVDIRPATPEELAQRAGRSGNAVTVRIRPTMPVGRFVESIVLGTNSENVLEVEIQVAGSRAGPVTMFGAGFTAADLSLDLKRFKASEGITRKISLMVEKGQPMGLVDYESSSDSVTASIEKDESFNKSTKDRYILTVTVEPGIRPGLYDHDRPVELRMKTTNPDLGVLPIDVKFTALPD